MESGVHTVNGLLPKLARRPSWPFEMNDQSPQAKGLAGWWPLVRTEALITPEMSGHLQPAILNNMPADWHYDPELGDTLNFENITAADSLATQQWLSTGYYPSERTRALMGWMYMDTSAGDGWASLGIFETPDRRCYIGFNVDTNRYRAGLGNSFQTTIAPLGETLQFRRWYHIGIAADGVIATIYFNGKPTDTVQTSFSGTAVADIWMGLRNDPATGDTDTLDGRVTDVRVYEDVLIDDAFMAQVYNPRTRWDLYKPYRSVFYSWVTPVYRTRRIQSYPTPHPRGL